MEITVEDTGFSVAAELESVESPHELRFDVSVPDDAILALTEDGSIDLIDEDGFTIGTFAVPWATAVDGSDIATSYHLDGQTIVQIVNTVTSELYPIIADPKFTWGWINGTIILR